ncbi:MAG: DICT sensory domain-containing protein [Marmoricola sp.]
MTTNTHAAQALSIGDLAKRTGVSPEVLRMWEQRYGFPVPQRLPSGHRRYTTEDVDLVAHVVRRRDAGVRLDVAVAEALGSRAPAAPSVFAELRRHHPTLAPHRLRKSTLLALSWALEDEFCARAQAPVLFGGFQEERFFKPSASRWRELSRVSRYAMVFADFPGLTGTPAGPVRVPLPEDAPMRREWLVVCDSPDLAACLSAWELPGQTTVPDRDREFETVWTIDPRAVRDAARVCARVAHGQGVAEAAPLLHHLAEDPSAAVIDVLGATTLLNRVVSYVDRLA